MSNARIRLRKAREALSRAENSVGLRGRLDVEERYSTGGFVPVLLGPQERGQLIRLLIDACPYEGWVGLYGVRHIGWEWAQCQGMDLERVLVLNPDEEANAGQLCALLLEGCGVVCLDLPQLSRTEPTNPGGACPLSGAHPRDTAHVAGTLARRGRRGEHTAGGLGALHGPVDSRLARQLPRGRPTPGWCRRGCSC